MPALPVIPIEPFQLTSFALSLLLVFRTNSSYSRWYEGRRRFGRITTTCRDICRQVRRVDGAAGQVSWLESHCWGQVQLVAGTAVGTNSSLTCVITQGGVSAHFRRFLFMWRMCSSEEYSRMWSAC